MPPDRPRSDSDRLDRTVADAQRTRVQRQRSYREQALRIYPWICGRCAREFTRADVHLLTVHHRDHNHDNNPPDGSNWELLCVYCHEHEHSRYLHNTGRGEAGAGGGEAPAATYKPFVDLNALLKGKK